jgi:uncharacterized protein with von Willebrand factor type A (vWA) domain
MTPIRRSGAVLGTLALSPHLSSLQFVVLVGLAVVWMAPNWLHKLIVLAVELMALIEMVRRFRASRPRRSRRRCRRSLRRRRRAVRSAARKAARQTIL